MDERDVLQEAAQARTKYAWNEYRDAEGDSARAGYDWGYIDAVKTERKRIASELQEIAWDDCDSMDDYDSKLQAYIDKQMITDTPKYDEFEGA